MKLALICLMLMALIAVSNQQYLHNYPRSWWPPRQMPILHRYQQPHYYVPVDADVPYFRYAKPVQNARPFVIYPQEDDEWTSPELMGANGPYKNDDNQQDFADVQSRSRAPLLPEKVNPRLFFGTQAVIKNPFIKTATFTLSSTVTISSIIKCIKASEFSDTAAQHKTCSRKRKQIESIEKSIEQFPIVPSEPIKYEATALPPSIELMREGRQVSSWNGDSAIISSKDDEDDNRSRIFSPNSNKKKFLYLDSYNFVSTTVTSYKFDSTTVTRTIAVAIDAGLNCIPTGYVVCA